MPDFNPSPTEDEVHLSEEIRSLQRENADLSVRLKIQPEWKTQAKNLQTLLALGAATFGGISSYSGHWVVGFVSMAIGILWVLWPKESQVVHVQKQVQEVQFVPPILGPNANNQWVLHVKDTDVSIMRPQNNQKMVSCHTLASFLGYYTPLSSHEMARVLTLAQWIVDLHNSYASHQTFEEKKPEV